MLEALSGDGTPVTIRDQRRGFPRHRYVIRHQRAGVHIPLTSEVIAAQESIDEISRCNARPTVESF
jgi:hypothetical protein